MPEIRGFTGIQKNVRIQKKNLRAGYEQFWHLKVLTPWTIFSVLITPGVFSVLIHTSWYNPYNLRHCILLLQDPRSVQWNIVSLQLCILFQYPPPLDHSYLGEIFIKINLPLFGVNLPPHLCLIHPWAQISARLNLFKVLNDSFLIPGKILAQCLNPAFKAQISCCLNYLSSNTLCCNKICKALNII